jgi:hypothetical protein
MHGILTPDEAYAHKTEPMGLGPVDVHRSRMTVDTRAMNALKLVSVVQHLTCPPVVPRS